MPPFAPGQVWQYRTRPHEASSRLVILKVEEDGRVGRIVHVAVLGLQLLNPHADGGVSDTIGHLPFAERAVRDSVVQLEGFTGDPPDLNGYDTWREAFEREQAGVFSIGVDEAVLGMEAALNGHLA